MSEVETSKTMQTAGFDSPPAILELEGRAGAHPDESSLFDASFSTLLAVGELVQETVNDLLVLLSIQRFVQDFTGR